MIFTNAGHLMLKTCLNIVHFNIKLSFFKLWNVTYTETNSYLQPAKVTAHWHKGTTYMVKFEDSVITRDKQLEDR